MKTKKLLMGLGFMVTLTAFAGGEVGNGGVSVVCRNSDGTIKSAELLDVFEGKEIYGRTYSSEDISVETKIQLSQHKLTKHPSYLNKLQDELATIQANLVFVKEGIELNPTNDALPVINRRGCEYEQVANYTNEGEVLVSQEIYDVFNVTDKAALYVHEAVYALRRKNGDKTSQKARRLTAHLLASNGDQGIIDELVKAPIKAPSNGKEPCGLEGSVEDRIRDCSYQQSSQKGGFVLVTRTKEFKEVHKETKTGLLWGDRLPSTMTHFNAKKACNANLAEVAKISDVTWRLPSKEEYEEAEKNGIRRALPNMNYWFWSSSVHRSNSKVAWLFSGYNGSTDNVYYRNYDESVRCVAR